MIPNSLELISFVEFIPIFLLAMGLTYTVVGSKIGYPLRFFGCLILYKIRLSYFKNLITCPPCNIFWTAGALSYLLGYDVFQIAQIAFSACGVMAVLQYLLGGDGIGAPENFDELFKKEQS